MAKNIVIPRPVVRPTPFGGGEVKGGQISPVRNQIPPPPPKES